MHTCTPTQPCACGYRWLKLQINAGNVKVIRRDGVFELAVLNKDIPIDETVPGWLASLKELEDIPVRACATTSHALPTPRCHLHLQHTITTQFQRTQ